LKLCELECRHWDSESRQTVLLSGFLLEIKQHEKTVDDSYKELADKIG